MKQTKKITNVKSIKMEIPQVKDGKNVLFYAIGAVLVGVGIYYGYKKFAELFKGDPSNKGLKAGDSEIVNKDKSYTDSEYATMADRLFRALNGVGTTWDTVIATINKLRTKTDWLMLAKYFGVRKSTLWTSSFSGNLVEWLEEDLDGSEMTKISEILRKIGVFL